MTEVVWLSGMFFLPALPMHMTQLCGDLQSRCRFQGSIVLPIQSSRLLVVGSSRRCYLPKV
jgi:hypothetical protein